MNHKSHRWELNPRPLGDCDNTTAAVLPGFPMSGRQFAPIRRPNSPRIPFANDTQTTPMASAGRGNRRGGALEIVLLSMAIGLLGGVAFVHNRQIEILRARVSSAETKLRAVQWLAERRLDPAAVRADSLRRECAAAAARNGGADCGI